MTVKATWLGGPGELETCEWNGVTFPQGKAVELTDAFMIRKAKSNPFFSVDDHEGEAESEAEAAKPTKADHLAKARAAKAAAKAARVEKIDA